MIYPHQLVNMVRESDKRSKYNLNHNHVAILMNRGKVVATATNQIGSRSSGSGYSDNTIHAEKNVIKKAGDISKIRGATLYVIRINRSFHTCNSKPCHECELFLRKCMNQYGLRRVFYSM